ncbi:DUF2333 family protein [Vibrio alginolyticus]|nr:DUF2333 family protein [Vibrio alginolyticus]
MNKFKDWCTDIFDDIGVFVISGFGIVVGTLLFVAVAYFIQEPSNVDVGKHQRDSNGVLGYTLAATTEEMIGTLLDKPLGYVSNDIAPPWILLDDITNWEQGVITQLQYLTLSFYQDFSRPSGSQSLEDPDLKVVQGKLRNETGRWIATDYQTHLRNSQNAMNSYIKRLLNDDPRDGQFTSKATSLHFWLNQVHKSLGDLSQKLSASRGDIKVDTALAGEKGDVAWAGSYKTIIQTPYLEVDDVYWNARGQAWALLAAFKAIRTDFAVTLEDKSAAPLVDQIILSLEFVLRPVESPYIFNGSKHSYGYTPNYSQLINSDLTRASNTIGELLSLLSNG